MWTHCPALSPKFRIQNVNGKLFWNTQVHITLNYPTMVDLWFDQETNRVGVTAGTRHSVLQEEDSFYIMAKEDLQYFGLSFPLQSTKEYLLKSVSTDLPYNGILTIYYFDLDEPL